MAYDIRSVRNITDLIGYFSENLNWAIDIDDFDDIEDISYDFEAEDIGLKEENFAKISSLRQLQPLVDGQQWGIFCIEFDSNKFEVSALRKILSKFVPKRRSMIDHAVWEQQDLLFICNWGEDNNRTIGIAHFEDQEKGLPQIKMISCAPALEDFTQIKVFEDRLAQLAWPKNTSNIDAWREAWSNAFASGYRQTIQDSSTLTIQLAAEAQNIRNRILSILDVETKNGYVHLLYDKFKDTLIHDMTEQQFADMYAQTVVYGLFSARCMDSTQDDFSAAEAIDCIPSTNPFLKSLMRECLGSQGSNKLSFDELEIGNVVDLLLHTKTDEIIKDFNRQTGGGREDPVIHFYEEFLTAYDKSQKVQRGVYYTPQPVVNFIVRAVDSILKTEFGYEDGLASTETKKIKVMRDSRRRVNGYKTQVEEQIEVPAVQILDPATGTGTFLRQTILQIYENFQQKHKGEPKDAVAALWNKYVDESLLPRLNGFELMMAPYAVAHMKLAMVLKDTGYDFSGTHRLNVFLTNSLEKAGNSDNQLTLFDDPLAIESIEANKVKKNTGINIMIGNPPYAGESSNKGEWILSLIEDYKKEPGGQVKLQEQNSKWINDDYVKFIRLSQEFINSSSAGIMAFICPHGFIDNPTFRGMRWNLLKMYDKIYVLDLHGNAKKQETALDGSKDENVFDIQQGVCITLMIRNGVKSKGNAEVYHADCFGVRDFKYSQLSTLQVNQISWSLVNYSEPFYLFKPVKESGIAKSELYSTAELFVESVMGFQTHRDNFAISTSREEIAHRVDEMCDESISDDILADRYSISDNRDWKIARARARIRQDTTRQEKITSCQYRIWDIRSCYLDEGFMDYPRGNVFCHVTNKDNYVFGVGRQGLAVGNIEWCLATVSKYAMDANIFRRGGITAAPLYVYRSVSGRETRTPNLDLEIIKKFENAIGKTFVPEIQEDGFSPIDIMDYTYAILYSHKYRSAFADDLKIDYPKVPYPVSPEYFELMAGYGAELRGLHTMEIPIETEEILISDESNMLVDKYVLKDGKIYLNKNCFFMVSTGESLDEAWNYTIGGNQPLQKWLKDRKKTHLSKEDIIHYKKMIIATLRTILLMSKIDDVINL